MSLDTDKKKKILDLVKILEERKKSYKILSTELQEHQAQVLPYIKEKIEIDWKLVPEKKYILFQWGNGSWKTMVLMYIVSLLALGDLVFEYWLPYIWSKKEIWVVTKSWSNVTSTILPYLIGDYSPTRLPPETIKKIDNEKNIIYLKNWAKILIKTYDQGRERLQWGNPDFIGVDEEPTKTDVWDEIMVRARVPSCQLFLSMTPLSGFTPVYTFFYENENEIEGIDRRKTFLVSSLENKHIDHSWLLLLTEEQRKSRLYWQFVPTTWLVFSSFNRNTNVVPHFDPKDLWLETRFYAWLDFGLNHPTAFVLLAIDWDGNIFAFDGFCKSGMLLEDIASEIKRLRREYWIELEYIVADSAWKRERTELKKYGIQTTPADKFSKGENWESNRKAGIFLMNQLFHSNKLYISDKLMKSLVKELETHHYKNNWKDWDVVKENDDFIDALRYVIWSVKPKKVKTLAQDRFENKYWVEHNKNNYYKELYKQPY